MAWRELRHDYSFLFFPARHLLLALAHEVSCERLFSRAKRIAADTRASLSADMVSALTRLSANGPRFGNLLGVGKDYAYLKGCRKGCWLLAADFGETRSTAIRQPLFIRRMAIDATRPGGS